MIAPSRSAAARALVIALCLSLPACAGDGAMWRPEPAYPEAAARLPGIDVQLAQEGKSVALTNTTAATLVSGRLWLNQWYGLDLDATPIGARVTLPLARFLDEHGQPMPGGGFFSRRAPERVVTAELETPEGVFPLTVVVASR